MPSRLHVVALPMGESTFAADEPYAGQTGFVVPGARARVQAEPWTVRPTPGRSSGCAR